MDPADSEARERTVSTKAPHSPSSPNPESETPGQTLPARVGVPWKSQPGTPAAHAQALHIPSILCPRESQALPVDLAVSADHDRPMPKRRDVSTSRLCRGNGPQAVSQRRPHHRHLRRNRCWRGGHGTPRALRAASASSSPGQITGALHETEALSGQR